MNVPIRMLGIITLIFWIILIAFIASAAYAIKDINFNVGKPEFAPTPSGDIKSSLPLYIDNTGYYDLKGFNITTVVFSENDHELVTDSTFVPVISKGQNATIVHNVTLHAGQLAERNPQLMLNDTEFNIVVAAGFDFAKLMPTQLSTNFTYPWGAPFHNLALGLPRYSTTGPSITQAALTLSFDNHAAFDIVGAVSAKIYDSDGKALAESQTPIAAPMQTHFTVEIVFPLSADSAPESSLAEGHVELFFSTPAFEYGPVVIPYG